MPLEDFYAYPKKIILRLRPYKGIDLVVFFFNAFRRRLSAWPKLSNKEGQALQKLLNFLSLLENHKNIRLP